MDEQIERCHGHDHVQQLHIEDLKERPVKFFLIVPDFGNLPVSVGIDAEDAEQDEPVHDRAGVLIDAEHRFADMDSRIWHQNHRKNDLNDLVQGIVEVVSDQFSIHAVFFL